MSEAALRERVQKQRWAAPGGAHDLIIRFMKVALPAIIGVLAAYLAVVPMRRDRDVSFILDKSKAPVAKERMRLSSARYRGQDNKGRPFSIDAQTAVQATSREPVVVITGMSARLGLESGPAQLEADKAHYNMDTEKVQVIGPVLFTDSEGFRLETRDVLVDLNQRTLMGENGIEGSMPLGRFSADAVKADLAERLVVLTGRARLRIEQGIKR